MLNVQVVAEPAGSHIHCQGVLDASTAAEFAISAQPVFSTGGTVVADLSDVVRLDSSGVGALSHLFRRLAETDRRLEVEGLRGQPLALLSSVGLDRILAQASPRNRGGLLRQPLRALVGRV